MYDAADPRGFYTSLLPLGYQVPGHGAAVFRHLVTELRRARADVTVLDVACSYGVNAAVLNHDVTFEEVLRRYASQEVARLRRDELLAADRRFYAERRREDAVRVVGLDVASNAVAYALKAGLLDAGVTEDLETPEPPSQAALDPLDGVQLVTITGGGSYVGARTFDRILTAQRGPDLPWVAALTLRWIGFDAVAACLERFGLVTERLDGYAALQRRFADDRERQTVLDGLAARGLEPTPEEAAGWHVADLYVARPEESVRARPLRDLLSGCSGVHRA